MSTLGRHWHCAHRTDAFRSKKRQQMLGNTNLLGHRHSAEAKAKISAGLKASGRRMSEDNKAKLSAYWTGRHHTDESRSKIGDAHRGERSNFWSGGISHDPYPIEFNRALKERVFRYYGTVCQICLEENRGRAFVMVHPDLHVHHIDYDKTNNALSNLIPLCHHHHARTNHRRDYWLAYFHSPEFLMPYGARPS